MAVSAVLPRSEKETIGLIGAAHFCSHFYQLTLPPLFYFIKADLGVSYTALGLVMTIFFVATALVQVPVGMLVDRIGARKVLIVGLLMQAAAVAMAGLAQGYWGLAAAFLVAGLGNSVFHPADFAILNAAVHERFLGRAFAVHTFGGSVGFALAPVLTVSIAAWADWRMALIAAGAMGIAVGLVVLASGDRLAGEGKSGEAETGAAADASEKPGWRFLGTRPMVMLFVFYIFISASGTGMTNFSAVALIDIYGTPVALANAALTTFLITAMIGSLPGGWVADATTHHDMVVAGMFLTLAAATIAIGSGALATWAIFAAMVIGGIVRGAYNASRDMLVRNAAPDGRVGSTFAFVTLGYTVGQGATPVVYGWLMDRGAGEWVFYVSAAFAVAAIATMFGSAPGGREPDAGG